MDAPSVQDASHGRPFPATQHYGFLLVPGFTLIGFSSAVEPLRMANLANGHPLFRWSTISLDGAPVRASNDVPIQPDHALDQTPALDALFVCGSNPIPSRIDSHCLNWLRHRARHGTVLGGICTGSYWLARAGLLNGYRCTLHWEDTERLLSDFPEIIVSKRIYEIDRDRYTCSGGIAPVDLMVALIGLRTGSNEIAAKVSELMVCERIRSTQDPQRIPLRQQLGTSQPKLTEIVTLMENNLEEPLTKEELAQFIQVSVRQLERLFQEHLKCTPNAYYLELRLRRARQLLLSSEQSIIDVAAACGFVSVTHFTHRYRDYFGTTPGRERRVVPFPNLSTDTVSVRAPDQHH
ncbi:GlxA family transcriptional regulator [Castellaniella caeni]|uniref:GlxA family transcriptional regulator n=1 Tax=Castellaniella caeni TaxID=266123 RepID=UPI000AB0D236|nr:GlxA family transcriptional regulator [Castellaniella caeni]